MISRRQLSRLLAAGGGAVTSGCARPSAEQRAAADRIVQEVLSVDPHSHAGIQPRSRLSVDQQIDKLGQGRVNACVFTASADSPVLGHSRGRDIYVTRTPAAVYAHTYRALQPLLARIESAPPGLPRGDHPGLTLSEFDPWSKNGSIGFRWAEVEAATVEADGRLEVSSRECWQSSSSALL